MHISLQKIRLEFQYCNRNFYRKLAQIPVGTMQLEFQQEVKFSNWNPSNLGQKNHSNWKNWPKFQFDFQSDYPGRGNKNLK